MNKEDGRLIHVQQWVHEAVYGYVNPMSHMVDRYDHCDGVGLQALYDKYKEKDFVIIGFPSNQVNSIQPLL